MFRAGGVGNAVGHLGRMQAQRQARAFGERALVVTINCRTGQRRKTPTPPAVLAFGTGSPRTHCLALPPRIFATPINEFSMFGLLVHIRQTLTPITIRREVRSRPAKMSRTIDLVTKPACYRISR